MKDNTALLMKMIAFDAGDAERIQHFIKVYEFAKIIGTLEKLPPKEQHILETAAIVHDIGIHPAEKKYGSCEGKLQEKEGAPEAEKMLQSLGYDNDVINRVSYLVGHHHTYTNVEGMDYRILLEADFLVNLFEEKGGKEAIEAAYRNIFRTETGKRICREMFGISEVL